LIWLALFFSGSRTAASAASLLVQDDSGSVLVRLQPVCRFYRLPFDYLPRAYMPRPAEL
jgi:hypothetical protein